MAEMWPQELPSWIINDAKRSTEVAVYRKLRQALDGEWKVYYSRPWWGLDKFGAEKDGEADFVICHPSAGILFLEVKGGKINYDPFANQWFSHSRNGITYRIKDPIAQAKTCKYVIGEKLRSMVGWPKVRVRMRHGVVFPHTVMAKSFLSAEADENLFCTSIEFEGDLKSWISKRLAPNSGQSRELGPGVDGIALIESLLASPAEFAFSLSAVLDGETQAMAALLTGFQLSVVHTILNSEKTLVEGGAGTGKSLIGLEIAKRLAHKNMETLFVSKSQKLLSDLSAKLGSEKLVRFLEYRNFQANSASNASLVIVDETQDFDYKELEYLQACIPLGTRQVFLMDSNQAVFNNPTDVALRLGLQEEKLSINLRNTRSIAELSSFFYRGLPMHFEGPTQHHLEWRDLPMNEAQVKALNSYREILGQSVRPNQVVILVPNLNVKQQITNLAANMKLETCEIETVEDFKGREREIVILVCDRELARDTKTTYVAISRAMLRLYIYGRLGHSALENALSRLTDNSVTSERI